MSDAMVSFAGAPVALVRFLVAMGTWTSNMGSSTMPACDSISCTHTMRLSPPALALKSTVSSSFCNSSAVLLTVAIVLRSVAVVATVHGVGLRVTG